MKNKILSGLFLVGTLVLSSVPVAGGVIAFTDQASWVAGGLVGGTIDFTGLAATNYNTPLVIAPLQFAAGASTYLTIVNNFGPGTGNFIATFNNVDVSATAGYLGTIFGLGFNVKCYACSTSPNALITITDSASNVYTFNAPDTASYFGIRSTLAITDINISYGAGNYVALDDVGYGGAGSSTPEAATFVMIATGLGLMYRLRRRLGGAMPTIA